MSIIDTAKSYIGKVVYSFGANDIDGGKGDCSSFTQTVFAKNGIEIGRDTNAQWQQGTSVSRSELQAGDLVFFKDTYASGNKDGVSHVGIYEGNDTFIHLSDDGVEESSLSSAYYNTHYLGARRMDGVSEVSIGSEGSDSGLKWWGDIVKIVIALLLVVGGIISLAVAIKVS